MNLKIKRKMMTKLILTKLFIYVIKVRIGILLFSHSKFPTVIFHSYPVFHKMLVPFLYSKPLLIAYDYEGMYGSASLLGDPISTILPLLVFI